MGSAKRIFMLLWNSQLATTFLKAKIDVFNAKHFRVIILFKCDVIYHKGCFDALLDWLARTQGDRFSQLCAAYLLVTHPVELAPILSGYRSHNDEAVLKIQEWIELCYTQLITVQQLAIKFSIGERTLARRFKQASGVTPIQYLQQVRIDKAKKLLLSTSYPVSNIVYEVGYENVGYFIKLFKKHTGQTPLQWREVQGKIHSNSTA